MENFALGTWQVDALGRRLTHLQDRCRPTVRLSNKANKVLMALVEAEGQVVTREALLDSAWPDVVVGEEVLTHAIAELRRALGDSPRMPQYIETVHKAGYRLLAAVAAEECLGPTAAGPPNRPEAPANSNGGPAPGVFATFGNLEEAIRLNDVRSNGAAEGPTVSRRGAGLGHKQSVAVLPFVNLTGDPDKDRIGDGLAEDLIVELARFRSLVVAARHSSSAYRQRPFDPCQAGRDLEADYLLLGSLRCLGQRLRISIQLVDTRSGSHIWAERYDRRPEQLIAAQDEMTATIVSTLADQISSAQLEQARRRPLSDWYAYDHYMMARRYSQMPRTAEHLGHVLYYARSAVEADSQFAPGHSMLANAHRWLAVLANIGDASEVRTAYSRARDCALKASELNPKDPETLRSLGWSYLCTRNYAEAERFLERSFAVSPHDGDVAMSWVTALSYLGRPEEAAALAEKTILKTPQHPDYYLFDLGEAYFFAGREEQAVTLFEQVPDAELDESLVVVIAALALSGRAQAAQRQATRYAADLESRWAGAPGASLAERIAWEFEFRHVYSRPRDTARLREGLRQAGLPA